MSAVLCARGVGKTFWPARSMGQVLRRAAPIGVPALSGISLAVAPGEVVALLGKNGAGKTTLLRILAGALAPSEGTVELDGQRLGLGDGPALGILWVLGDDRSFAWRISPRANLEFYATLFGHDGPQGRRRTAEVLELVGLTPVADRPVSGLSMGMRQRLALGRGLLARARVLLLDEPTRSIDPSGARELRRLIFDQLCRREGLSAVVATHSAVEARAADRGLVLEEGRVVQEGTVAAAIAHGAAFDDDPAHRAGAVS